MKNLYKIVSTILIIAVFVISFCVSASAGTEIPVGTSNVVFYMGGNEFTLTGNAYVRVNGSGNNDVKGQSTLTSTGDSFSGSVTARMTISVIIGDTDYNYTVTNYYSGNYVYTDKNVVNSFDTSWTSITSPSTTSYIAFEHYAANTNNSNETGVTGTGIPSSYINSYGGEILRTVILPGIDF